MLLFIDTETTGKLDFQLPMLHPSQPRLVQIGAYLAADDEDFTFRQSLDMIVKPDGWTIPDEAARIHGITTERATAFGEPLDVVLDHLQRLIEDADENMSAGRFIAHNVSFDNRILLSEFARSGRDVMSLGMLRPFCTMRSLTDRMKLPGRFPGRYKWPSLDEAYRFCFGPDASISGRDIHHGAMVDLLACKEIFIHGRKQEWWR